MGPLIALARGHASVLTVGPLRVAWTARRVFLGYRWRSRWRGFTVKF